MNKLKINKIWHAEEPLRGEYSLCGISFDDSDDWVDTPVILCEPVKKLSEIQCKHCIKVIREIKSIKI